MVAGKQKRMSAGDKGVGREASAKLSLSRPGEKAGEREAVVEQALGSLGECMCFEFYDGKRVISDMQSDTR